MMKHTYQKNIRMGVMAIAVAAATFGLLGCQSQVENAEGQPAPPAEQSAEESPSVFSSLFSGGETVEVGTGTAVKVRTQVSLSTKTHKPGDEFRATLVEPLVAGNQVVAARGAEVHGVVAQADPGGKVKGRAHISVRLTELETINNEMVDIDTDLVARQAKSTKKKDAAKIGIGSGIGAAVGAIAGGGKGAAIGAAAGGGAGTGVVLATRGAPATIPSESLLTFRLAAPVKVTLDS